MVKRVIDEKIKQYQDLKEWLLKHYFDLSNESKIIESKIILINMAINDLETIKFLYLHELKDKGKYQK